MSSTGILNAIVFGVYYRDICLVDVSFHILHTYTLFHNTLTHTQKSVGKKMVNEALSSNPTFDIYFGLDGWMLSMLTSGMNPVTSIRDAICQVTLMGLLRFISLFYLMDFGRITQNCHDTKKIAPKDSSKHD